MVLILASVLVNYNQPGEILFLRTIIILLCFIFILTIGELAIEKPTEYWGLLNIYNVMDQELPSATNKN